MRERERKVELFRAEKNYSTGNETASASSALRRLIIQQYLMRPEEGSRSTRVQPHSNASNQRLYDCYMIICLFVCFLKALVLIAVSGTLLTQCPPASEFKTQVFLVFPYLNTPYWSFDHNDNSK